MRLRGRSLLLVMLLMYNARGSSLLKMMRRRTLLRVVGMMLHRGQILAIFLKRRGKCSGKI
jgi:hypothetical protein